MVNDVGAGKEGEPSAEKVVAESRPRRRSRRLAGSAAAPDSARKIVQAALDTFGRIDCVVNNAGIVRDRFFFQMSADEWKAVVDVLNGSSTLRAAPHFKAQAAGSYVVT